MAAGSVSTTLPGATRWTLKPEIEIQSDHLSIVDLDDDGKDELLVKIDYRNIVRDQKGVIVRQIDFPDANCRFLEDFRLDNGEKKTLLFQRNYHCTLTAYIWRDSIVDEFLVATGEDLHPPKGWHCYMTHAYNMDINGDGYEDLLCFISTPYELQPRGMWVYDIRNHKEIWHFWMGAVHCLHGFDRKDIADIDGDGKIDIVMGTISPCNGSFANGIDDYSSYVLSINGDGVLQWIRKVGEESTIVKTWKGDIDGDSTIEVVACVNEGLLENEEPNAMFILDAVSGKVERYRYTGEKYLGLEVCDLDRDGNLEIISGNTDGKIRVFDQYLNVVRERDFSNSVKVLHVCDFDANGRTEILATTRDGKIFMLDEGFEVVLEEKMEQTVSWLNAGIVNYGRKKRILFRIGEKRPFTYKLMSIAPVSPITIGSKILGTYIACFLAFCVICVSLFVLMKAARKYRMTTIAANSIQQGTMILDADNRIAYANKFAREYLILGTGKIEGKKIGGLLHSKEMRPLLEWITGADDNERKEFTMLGEGIERQIALKAVKRGKGRLVIINDVTEKETHERIISWAGVAQKLAHEIKNPLSTVTLTLQRLQKLYQKNMKGDSKKLDEYTDSILEEVERLRQTTDKFMKILSIEKPVFEPNDINKIIEDVLSRYEKVLPESIIITVELDDALPLLRCDRNQLLILFSNLVENSIEALRGEGSIMVKTAFMERVINVEIMRFVEVRIEDTGQGVPEKDMENLFMPFYSTKENGTGLGLVFSQQIVKVHGGKIEIDSKRDVGTIVSVLLPIKD